MHLSDARGGAWRLLCSVAPPSRLNQRQHKMPEKISAIQAAKQLVPALVCRVAISVCVYYGGADLGFRKVSDASHHRLESKLLSESSTLIPDERPCIAASVLDSSSQKLKTKLVQQNMFLSHREYIQVAGRHVLRSCSS